jgi:uncharacterized glyoxalase superfamily protein PhnB
MSEVLLIEQLDQAIEAMLRDPVPVSAVSAGELEEIAELLSIAGALRDLPRPEFKARLMDELRKEASLSASTIAAESTGEQTSPNVKVVAGSVTPYLVVPDVHAGIAFMQAVFGATGHVYGLGSQGGFHAEYTIGNSLVMIGGGGAGSRWRGTPAPATLHAYVEDVDAAFQRAVQAGATNLSPPVDQPYGDREAGVTDSQGNQWYLATRQGVGVPEDTPNVMPYLHPKGAPKMIEFLKQAFDAEEIAVHQSPDGIVQHAKIRVGSSVIEMGEAHGPWQPNPMHFMLKVQDCDEVYDRAIKTAEAVSMSAPRNQPYGDRVATIKDPFDNVWYVASHIAGTEKNQDESERSSMAVPKMFRVAVQVADLDSAADFYGKLLDDPGRRIPRGSRHYFDCGPMILALVDVAAGGQEAKPIPDYLYFAVADLKAVHERAKALGCLAKDEVHGEAAGEMVRRPWGELSFYAEDPWGNGLCFVDETTLFTGK